jgi:hypothetical protein
MMTFGALTGLLLVGSLLVPLPGSAQTSDTGLGQSQGPTSRPGTTEPEPTAPPTFRPDQPQTSPTTVPPTQPDGSTPSTSLRPTTVPLSDESTLAPVCGVVVVDAGAGCRLIAYYGTPLSRNMGILGRTSPESMLVSLKNRTAQWQVADPETPTRCVLELITIIAQAAPGASGLYRSRTDPAVIRKVIGWARGAGCLVLLDIQVGWSSVAAELGYLEPFLREPDVHLAIDPEWDMPEGVKPGSQIGTTDASEINTAVDLLDRIVRESKGTIGPKLLVVHRFREFMVTNPSKIKTPQTIRLVANMDGFGTPSRKLDSYRVALKGMPTKLAGFKLFTKIDTPMLEPKDVLNGAVKPVPVFLNYQ